MNSDVIVIGADHYNTLWLIRSLGFFNILPDVIIFDKSKKSFVAHSKYINSFEIVNSSSKLITLLMECATPEKKLIISSSDIVTRILDSNYEQLKPYFILSNIGKKNFGVSCWMDKAKMIKIAKSVGINVPRSVSADINEIRTDTINVEYPCLIKPQLSVNGHKADFRVCLNKSELDSAIVSLKGNCENILLQQYIDRDFEFVINGVRYNNRHIIPGIVRKTMVGKKLYNMGMTTMGYTESNTGKYIDVSLIKKMMDLINYEGIYSIEFIVSKGIAYLLEINFRSDATIYISTAGGFNLPVSLYNMVKNKEYSKANYCRKAYGMAEISYIKEIPWKKPWSIIIDWWKTDVYSIFCWKDLKPFVYKFIYFI